MRGKNLFWRLALVAFIVFAVGFGMVALSTTAQAKPPCRCPLIVAPVICDNGKVYVNSCFASCDRARNCVPYEY